MNKRTSYIAAAALAIAGTVGMASWLALEAKDETRHAAAEIATGQPGVAETETVLPALQVQAIEPVVAQPLVEQPIVYAPPAPPVRAARTTRTPIAAAPAQPAPAAADVERVPAREPEPVEPVEPVRTPEPRYIEVRVPSGTVLGIRLATNVSSETAELEDRVEATVTRDVIADGRIAIPAGTTILGSVNEVTRGGKFRERARIGVRFHTLVLAEGVRETVRVDPIVREGDSPVRESTAKIGIGAAGGAVIGGIVGGRKGAILGGMAGAGAGTAAVVAGDRSTASLSAGSPLSVRLDAPVTLTIERNRP